MNVLIQPSLDGIASERLRSFAGKLENADTVNVRELVSRETGWAQRSSALNGQAKAYEASVRLLADLRMLKWKVRADAFGLELESPPNPRAIAGSVTAILESKEAVRKELQPVLAQQFADPAVRRFIEECENPPASSKRHRIQRLIADGAELAARLEQGRQLSGTEREAALRSAVQPYLQLVPGEQDLPVRDEFTGLPLGEVWRYFRYTWCIPQTPIPGRQMFYLVRDRAHPCHAVIGIAALGNSPLLSPDRDKKVGWTAEAFRERFEKAAADQDAPALRCLRDFLLQTIEAALAEIDPTGLATAAELAHPTQDTIDRLQRRSHEFAHRRAEALRERALAETAHTMSTIQETEGEYGIPKVSLDLLNLEGKITREGSIETKARTLLVAKKRAFELARLLRARLAFRECHRALEEPAKVSQALANESMSIALGTALLAAKSNRIGTNILEITTCGAIAPYSHLLGGKLVALLLLSPEVADDYRRRYRDRASIISSQMKNERRTKDCTLAWLNTTSLYALGSSQYERLRLPRGVIAPDQMEIRYDKIGVTVGYGTVQFSDSTMEAIQKAYEERHEFRQVNSIFGEGFSPKFRKLRDGMDLLGFNPAILMRHDQFRRVYAVRLWGQAPAFLRGEPCGVPDYIREPHRFPGATERIADFWRCRWLASRLEHQPALEALARAPLDFERTSGGRPSRRKEPETALPPAARLSRRTRAGRKHARARTPVQPGLLAGPGPGRAGILRRRTVAGGHGAAARPAGSGPHSARPRAARLQHCPDGQRRRRKDAPAPPPGAGTESARRRRGNGRHRRHAPRRCVAHPGPLAGGSAGGPPVLSGRQRIPSLPAAPRGTRLCPAGGGGAAVPAPAGL